MIILKILPCICVVLWFVSLVHIICFELDRGWKEDKAWWNHKKYKQPPTTKLEWASYTIFLLPFIAIVVGGIVDMFYTAVK